MRLFVALILFLCTNNLTGQVYHPIAFADSGIVWNGYSTCVAMGHGWPIGWSYSISVDTTINAVSYRKINSATKTLGVYSKRFF